MGIYYGIIFEHDQAQNELKRTNSAIQNSTIVQEAHGVHTGGFSHYLSMWAHLPWLKSPLLHHVIVSAKEVLKTVFYNISFVMQLSKYRYIKLFIA